MLFAALCGLALCIFRDFGIPSDAQAWDDYGSLLLNYYRSGGADLHAVNFWNWHWYGGAFHLVDAWMAAHLAWPRHEVRNLLVAITGLLGIAGCWRIGNFLAGPRAGFFGAALLTLTPLYFGQMFTNAKDVPFAAAYVWALAAVIEAAALLPRFSWGAAVRIGVLSGLALGIRIGGVLLPGYLALAIGAFLVTAPPRAGAIRLVGRGAVAVVIAFLVMLVFWPYAQANPVFGPWHALTMFSHFNQSLPMPFAGRVVFSDALPRWYAPWWLAITLPEPALLFLAVAGVLAWRTRRPFSPSRQPFGLLGVAALLPVVLVILMRSTLYNGIRHLIFVLPPLAAIAGVVLDGLLTRLGARTLRGPLLLLGLWAAVQVRLLARLHPYEYIGVNRLAGGIRGAAPGYELDFWGESLRDGAKQLSLELFNHPSRQPRTIRVFVCPNPYSAQPFLPEGVTAISQLAGADYALVTTCSTCPEYSGRDIARVERGSVTLTRVLGLKP